VKLSGVVIVLFISVCNISYYLVDNLIYLSEYCHNLDIITIDLSISLLLYSYSNTCLIGAIP